MFARDVVDALGSPAENRVDEDGDQLLAYPELGISFLAFDHEENVRLTSYELDRTSDAGLWGLQVFGLPRPAIVEAAAARGLLFIPSSGDLDRGEILFHVRSQALDFYFEGEILLALAAGVLFSADDTIEWPPGT